MVSRYTASSPTASSGRSSKVWVFALVLSVVCNIALGLGLVWSNIEQVDIAYRLKKLQDSLAERQMHSRKLGLERDNLLSPYRLNKKAEELGMRPASATQIRRIE